MIRWPWRRRPVPAADVTDCLMHGLRHGAGCGCDSVRRFVAVDGLKPVPEIRAERDEAIAEVWRLQAMLARFGNHDPRCAIWRDKTVPCTCGFGPACAVRLTTANSESREGNDGR